MGRRRKNDPFNPFNPAEVAKVTSMRAKIYARKSEESAKRKEEKEAKIAERMRIEGEEAARIAERRRIEREETEKKTKLAEIKRENQRLEFINKRYRSPSLDPDFYIDLSEKKITKLSQYEKLIILTIHGLTENPEEYNGLGLLINYLQANFENEKEKKKELESYIRLNDFLKPNYIKDVKNSSITRTLEEKLSSLDGLARYHHENCSIRGTYLSGRDDTQTCSVCETTTKAIELLTKAKYVE